MIPFNVPCVTGKEDQYLMEVIKNKRYSGDGPFTKKCHTLIEKEISCKKVYLTTSCTHALDMTAILIGIRPGDEVIMPSYTFTSTANAFVLQGAKIVFIDVRPDTMNIDESLIEAALSDRTRAICAVHYAGVSCDMDAIADIAQRRNLYVIEDAAQAVQSKYKGRWCGTLGHMGCYSFHETKNLQCGEGGALIVNRDEFKERAEILREKGTDRSKFFRGEVDKYSWVDRGSSYLPSELNAAFLCAQLEAMSEINDNRIKSFNLYNQLLKGLKDQGLIELPHIPAECEHNGHMFYIKVKDNQEREKLIAFLKEKKISTVFHYVPLHSSKAGQKFGTFFGEDRYTTRESERLLRLPLYYKLAQSDSEYIAECVHDFYSR